jgi:hypothetical protein
VVGASAGGVVSAGGTVGVMRGFMSPSSSTSIGSGAMTGFAAFGFFFAADEACGVSAGLGGSFTATGGATVSTGAF